MNINIFFAFLFAGLMLIFFLFKPMFLKSTKSGEIANFEVSEFTIHELDTKGLTTILQGSKGFSFADRYEVLDVNYTDSSRDYIANITSNNGIYKNDTIDLKGNVVYTREDGLIFKSQSAVYNQKSAIAYTKDKYIIYRNKDKMSGSDLIYDNRLDKIHSKNVRATYNLQER